ncbi:uncharacterized protein HKW66_Vig0000900 [Vigna angularis]|uniref:Pectinesterase inhibitor domain-containing protein n=1 Tax=Phaseolus angularis TaxID=3914 RepID=A0A8T0LH29_PHAAN|nr:uncharacterized protein HKW66_Vig0000900 [Vigna angularis]
MQDKASKMENKRKTLLLLLLLMATPFFYMPNVTEAASDVNFEGHLTHSELVKGPIRKFLSFVVCIRGQRSAEELAGHAVQGATVFLQALMGTERCVGSVTQT